MGSLVGHLYPRLVRFALRVKEQEKTRTQCRIRELRTTRADRCGARGRIEASGDRNRSRFLNAAKSSLLLGILMEAERFLENLSLFVSARGDEYRSRRRQFDVFLRNVFALHSEFP